MRVILIILLLLPSFAFAELVQYRNDIVFLSHKDSAETLSPTKIRLRYNEETASVYFFVNEGANRSGFSLGKESSATLQGALIEFLAKENGSSSPTPDGNRHRIAALPIDSGFWKIEKGNWELDNNPAADLQLSLTSQSDKTPYLALYFPEFFSGMSEYRPITLYIAKDNAQTLLQALDQSTIDKFLAERKLKKEAIASGYN